MTDRLTREAACAIERASYTVRWDTRLDTDPHRMAQDIATLQTQVYAHEVRLNRFGAYQDAVDWSLWTRLRWLFTGRLT
ncbi:MAG TPA: hypothetical protein VK595_12150 [Vicinamibacterales bacterium]|nr:hypothetical protein [Vicinamibacterales bacterium]